jgi:hypothetical protein
MSKALAAAISALALVQVATPALAQPSDLADRRIEQILRELVTKDASTPALTPVTRSASVKVTGTIRRFSQVKLPLTCTIFLSDRDSHNERKSGPVAFNGSVGTCTVVIPFRWANTDADGMIEVDVEVSNSPPGGSEAVATTGSDILRSSDFELPPVPLPKENATTQLTFDIRL